MYHLSNASGLRSSPSPVNFFGEGTLILSRGSESGTGAGIDAGSLAPSPWSDMLSVSLLLGLSGSSADAAAGALLDNPFCGDPGNPPGMTVAAFASSVTDSARSHCALSLASCLAASSIEKCYLAGAVLVALTNCPCSSLTRSFPFLGPFLGGLLPLGPWDCSILTC